MFTKLLGWKRRSLLSGASRSNSQRNRIGSPGREVPEASKVTNTSQDRNPVLRCRQHCPSRWSLGSWRKDWTRLQTKPHTSRVLHASRKRPVRCKDVILKSAFQYQTNPSKWQDRSHTQSPSCKGRFLPFNLWKRGRAQEGRWNVKVTHLVHYDIAILMPLSNRQETEAQRIE